MKDYLKGLASKYEVKEFAYNDPIMFPKSFCIDTPDGRIMPDIRDVEISAFLTSWISYGNRKQIIIKGSLINMMMYYKPYQYIISEQWRNYKGWDMRLYRFYTYGDFHDICESLHAIYSKYKTMELAMIANTVHGDYISRLQYLFQGVKGIPSLGSESACKRLAMFLRWMVRQNSPVDMGVWKNLDPACLIIPLDTHVHKQALKLGITNRRTADMRTAMEITEYFKKIWPEDPAKGDFALFGYGINNKTK